MIFYFTGTGNSQYAAKSLAADGEQVVSIVECLRKDNYAFSAAADESIGFVFPVYFGGLPVAVRQFIERLRLSVRPAYVYGVMTCGSAPAGAGAMLRDQLGEAGLPLNAAFAVQMPANCAVLYNIPSEESQEKTLRRAEKRLERIRAKLERRVQKIEGASVPGRTMTAVMYPAYHRARRTAPFHINDKCIGCAACANRCPSRAIEMRDGHPTWVRERCSFCMSCVRCGAIEYGDKLTDKARYKHPMLRKKSDHGDHGSAAASDHDHGAAAGHDHAGGEGACCPPGEGGGHDHGAAAGHDHAGGEGACCPPGEGGGHQH